MHLGVGDIPQEGHRIALNGEAWALTAAASAADGEVSSLTGELLMQQVGGGVLHVTGHASLVAKLACHRCGEATDLALEADVDLSYSPVETRRLAPSEEEVQLEEDELDAGWYEGTTLDMAAVLCEALTLAWPTRVVCSEITSCEQRTNALLDAGKTEMSPFAALSGLVDA